MCPQGQKVRIPRPEVKQDNNLHVIFFTAGLQTRLRGCPPNAPSSPTSPCDKHTRLFIAKFIKRFRLIEFRIRDT